MRIPVRRGARLHRRGLVRAEALGELDRPRSPTVTQTHVAAPWVWLAGYGAAVTVWLPPADVTSRKPMRIPLTRRRDGSASESAPAPTDAGSNRVFYSRRAGLVTAWYFSHRGEEELYRSERYNNRLALVVLDVASQGSAAQLPVGEFLSQNVRKADIAAYLGDGRYALLLPQTSVTAAQRLAFRLQRGIRNARVGVSSYPSDGENLSQLIDAAERSMASLVQRAA